MQPPSVREARRGDALDIATIQVRSWQATYAYGLDNDWLAALEPVREAVRHEARLRDDTYPAVYFIVRRGGRTLGYSMCGPERSGDGPLPPAYGEVGEVYALYVLPEAVGSGLGRLLLIRARDHLLERGCSSMLLWVMKGNERAIRFYARQGLPLDGASKEDGREGAGRWTDLRCSASLRDICAERATEG